MPPGTIYGEMWGDVGRYGEMWGDMGRCGEIWRDVGRYGLPNLLVREPERGERLLQLQQQPVDRDGVADCQRAWGDVGRCGEIWGEI